MRDLWVPGATGPHDDFIGRVHRQIARFAHERNLDKAVVEVELRDGTRFRLDSISPEPGYGFVTLVPHPQVDDDEIPSALIVQVASIDRIELFPAGDEPEARFGFSLPEPKSPP
ncbi:MAG: hypothetical protein H0T09_00675 [Actinobacteria bacterium]|nr:hypothetical protein [Actinomycetota bacterium]